MGETFKDIFYSYLLQNDTKVLMTGQKYSNGYKKNICDIVNNQDQFKFLANDIEDPDPYGVYHYISETLYQVLKERNSRLNYLYNTWYLIFKIKLPKMSPGP